MNREKTFYSLVINELIEYYKSIEVEGTEADMLTDVEFEFLQGRKEMQRSVFQFPGQYDNTFGVYDNMRKKVKECRSAFEVDEIDLTEGFSIQKPLFIMEKYRQKDVVDFLKVYLETAMALNREGKRVNPRIKVLNKEIDARSDFSVLKKVFAETNYSILFNYDELEEGNNNDVYMCWDRIKQSADNYTICINNPEILYQPKIFQYRRKAQILYKIARYEMSELNRDRFVFYGEVAELQYIRLQWTILLKTIMSSLDMLLQGGSITEKNFMDKCAKIEKIKIDISEPTKSLLLDDFWRYNYILSVQNNYLEELRIQIRNEKYIRSIDDIEEKYRFVKSDNELKDEFRDIDVSLLKGESLNKYNELFNFGDPVAKGTFRKYINFIADQIEELNIKTGRNLRPKSDILVYRAIYRAMFGCEAFQYHKKKNDTDQSEVAKKGKKRSPKTLHNIWVKYMDNDVVPDIHDYIICSNAISCLIYTEYYNGKNVVELKTELMKCIYAVLNKLLIEVLELVGNGAGYKKCTEDIWKLYDKIFDVLYEN